MGLYLVLVNSKKEINLVSRKTKFNTKVTYKNNLIYQYIIDANFYIGAFAGISHHLGNDAK